MPKLAEFPIPTAVVLNGKTPAAAVRAVSAARSVATPKRGDLQAESRRHARTAAKQQQIAERLAPATQELSAGVSN